MTERNGRPRLVAACAMAGVVLAACASAPEPAAGAPAAAAMAGEDKKVCRSEEVTGSVYKHSVCHTQAEWTAIDADRQKNADRARRSIENHTTE